MQQLSISGGTGERRVRNARQAHDQVCKISQATTREFCGLEEHVPRDSNEKVDALAAVAASLPIKETVFLLVYLQPASSITANQVNEIDEACSSWMTPIVRYLSLGEFSDNWIEAHKIQVKATRFSLVNG